MEFLIKKNKKCAICGSGNLKEFLNLGEMPPANAFLTVDQIQKKERRYPLRVGFCQSCSLVQLLDIVNPDLLFHDYIYITSASQPLVDHFTELSHSVLRQYKISSNDLVVEIGSNDGSLLANLVGRARVLGIEPSKNLAAIAAKRQVPAIADFFSSGLAKKILKKHGPAKAIFANNVLAHTPDLRDVFQGAHLLLKEDGVFVFEVHWVGNLIGNGGFDQIYHEHLFYYSLRAIQNLAKLTGFRLSDVRLVPIHGQSLQVHFTKFKSATSRVKNFLAKEKRLGIFNFKTYQKFSRKVLRNKEELVSLLKSIKGENKSIVGYGAPAKGNTLLNYCGIGNSFINYIVDTTPFKQGRYTPGTRLPIFFPEKILQDKPDYLLLLAWNYGRSIFEKEKDYRKAGGKFIIPVPKPKII